MIELDDGLLLLKFSFSLLLNLPTYSCIIERLDHALRFKYFINFNGEVFETPNYCNTLRHVEHVAEEVALYSFPERPFSSSCYKNPGMVFFVVF